MVITITKNNFENEVLRSDIPVLLDFRAPWCGPCRMLTPVITALAEKYEGRVKVCTVNIDEEPELADEFHVNAIPLIVLMKKGIAVNRTLGYRTQQQLEALLR